MGEVFSVYDETINHLMDFNIGIILVISLVFIGLIIWLLKAMRDVKLALVAFGSGVIIVALIYFSCVLPYQRDVDEHAYVMYTGEFYVEECSSYNRSGSYIFIKIPGDEIPIRYKVSCNVDEIKNDTTYYGYFAYGKNSKTLLDIKTST